jgi:PAS domain S-box-containing protein
MDAGGIMRVEANDDLSWLDDNVRKRALETLKALFAQSRICMMTFDAHGTIIGVNPHTAAFGGQKQSIYCGTNMLEEPLLRRLGWTELLKQVLAGEPIEVTDTRWVTLFSGEERYVDVTAAPVLVDGEVVGGVACLVDATAKHRHELARESKRLQARELELFLARDIGPPLQTLKEWSTTPPEPSLESTARAMVVVGDLASLFDDLQEFLQLGAYQPKLSRVVVDEAMRAAGTAPRRRASGAESGTPPSVLADPRLLRRVLRNIGRCGARVGGGGWAVRVEDGRVLAEIEVDCSHRLLEELLTANSLSMMEASGADSSLVAARWMIEMMGGTLTVADSNSILRINLAAAAAPS